MTECIRISEHLERLRKSWGADHFPVIIIQPATIAAFALLEDLQDRPECQAAFYKLCIVHQPEVPRVQGSSASAGKDVEGEWHCSS